MKQIEVRETESVRETERERERRVGLSEKGEKRVSETNKRQERQK